MLSGWRLLSDELTLIERKTGWIHALPRPISLKNESIPRIRDFSSDAFLSRPSRDTAQGTVAYLRPPKDSVRRQHEPARPGWVIFPKWVADGETERVPRSKPQTLQALTQQAFNFNQLGREGFRVCTSLVKQTDCFDFQYSRLDEAVAVFDRLADSAAKGKFGN